MKTIKFKPRRNGKPKPRSAIAVETPLTDQQQNFVREYLIDLNQTKAAMRAGYSPRSANEQGCMLMAQPNIRRAVEAALRERARRVEVDAEYVIERLAKEAETYAPEGNAQSRVKALELLGRHLLMFPNETNVRMSGMVGVSPLVRPELVSRVLQIEGGAELLGRICETVTEAQTIDAHQDEETQAEAD